MKIQISDFVGQGVLRIQFWANADVVPPEISL